MLEITPKQINIKVGDSQVLDIQSDEKYSVFISDKDKVSYDYTTKTIKALKAGDTSIMFAGSDTIVVYISIESVLLKDKGYYITRAYDGIQVFKHKTDIFEDNIARDIFITQEGVTYDERGLTIFFNPTTDKWEYNNPTNADIIAEDNMNCVVQLGYISLRGFAIKDATLEEKYKEFVYWAESVEPIIDWRKFTLTIKDKVIELEDEIKTKQIARALGLNTDFLAKIINANASIVIKPTTLDLAVGETKTLDITSTSDYVVEYSMVGVAEFNKDTKSVTGNAVGDIIITFIINQGTDFEKKAEVIIKVA